MFDVYGNHVEEGLEVQFQLDGFSILGLIGSNYKVGSLNCSLSALNGGITKCHTNLYCMFNIFHESDANNL